MKASLLLKALLHYFRSYPISYVPAGEIRNVNNNSEREDAFKEAAES